jgi:cytochrome c
MCTENSSIAPYSAGRELDDPSSFGFVEMGSMQTTFGNKLAMAGLGTLTFIMLTSFGGELLFAEKKIADVDKQGYPVAMPVATAAASGPAAPAAEPIEVRLASADKAKGETVFRQCTACHTPDKGGANKVGPNLWNVMGRAKGQVAGFAYSAGLKELAGKGEKWDFATMDKFIENPKGYIRGTSMSFGGIGNARNRADLIAYLASINDAPPALPGK